MKHRRKKAIKLRGEQKKTLHYEEIGYKLPSRTKSDAENKRGKQLKHSWQNEKYNEICVK